MNLNIPKNSDFSIHNLPFGIYSNGTKSKRVGLAIGNHIIDLLALSELGFFSDLDIPTQVFNNEYLNDFIALGKTKTKALRLLLQSELQKESSTLNDNNLSVIDDRLSATMHLPVKVGDYTDFYSSIEHATNVGKLFRDPENALLPNWRHLPVGYHGRASSIVVSDTPLKRPKGQLMPKGASQPIFKACGRLDYELETGFIIGKESALGQTISTAEAEDYIFGMVLFNDWSARDIQKWEYVPLGPFLGKNFGSSVSPWVVTLEALDPYRVAGPAQVPAVLPYLQYDGLKNFDINLSVSITPESGKEFVSCRSNFKYMYWNMMQQVAHHTINGCNLKVGDLMASGTISGKDEHSFGSLLELSWSGTKPIDIGSGQTRTFLEDGDTVTMSGYAAKDGKRIGFGTVTTKILPADL